MCVDAEGSCHSLCLSTITIAQTELPDPRSGASHGDLRFKDLAALPVWSQVPYLHGSPKLEVHLHSTGTKFEAEKMVGVDEGL